MWRTLIWKLTIYVMCWVQGFIHRNVCSNKHPNTLTHDTTPIHKHCGLEINIVGFPSFFFKDVPFILEQTFGF